MLIIALALSILVALVAASAPLVYPRSISTGLDDLICKI
jgi:hypothetical protein